MRDKIEMSELMKISFYSDHSDDQAMASNALAFETEIFSQEDAISTSEGVVVFDESVGKKKIHEAIKKNPGPIYLVLYSDMKPKELKDLQKGDSAPHAVLKRPVSEDFLSEIASDFFDESGEVEQENTTTKSGFNELTFVGVNKTMTKSDVTNNKSPAKNSSDSEESDDSNDAGFEATEFKMPDEVKEIIKRHSIDPQNPPNFEGNKNNRHIQKIFDYIFEQETIPEEESTPKFEKIEGEMLKGIAPDIKPIDTPVLDFDDEEEIADLTGEENKKSGKESKETGTDRLFKNNANLRELVEETLANSNTSEAASEDESADFSLNQAMPIPKSNPESANKKITEIVENKKEGSMSDTKEDASLMFDLGADLDKDLLGDGKNKTKEKTESKATPAPKIGDAGGDGLAGLDLDFSADELKVDSNAESAGSSSSGEQSLAELPDAGGLDLGDDGPSEEGATTVFKGGAVDLSAGGADDFELESSSGKAKDSTQTATATAEEIDLGMEIELTGKSAAKAKKETSAKKEEPNLDDDLNLDGEDEATKLTSSAKNDEDEAIQEFDYKTSVKSNELGKVALESDDVSMDEPDFADTSMDEEEEDAPTKVFTKNETAKAVKTAAKPQKVQEVFDVSGDDEDNSPLIIGAEQIPPATLNENDLVRLQATIRHLKTERESLLKENENLKGQLRDIKQDNLGLRTDIDDLRIEVSILRKRNEKDLSEAKLIIKTHEDRKALYEEKLKQYQKEIERLNHKLKVDFNQVRQREKELESKLELQALDAETQIKTRDKKILELKRKIDSLEFNMENTSIREQKFREDKNKMEEKMNKIIHNLRNSIKTLEEEGVELSSNDSKGLEKGRNVE